MDPATIIGVVLAFGALVTMITLEGASVLSVLLPAPMVLVFGATIAVAVASGTVKDAILAMKALPKAFTGKTRKPQEIIDELVQLAEKARNHGLLALEEEAQNSEDPFLKEALQSIADGIDADDLRIMLEDSITSKANMQRTASKFYTSMGGYAPTIGIVGTVVSLTHVLENLATPDELGPMVATAFVATLWGLLSANFLWLPIGTRLKRLTDLEVEGMNLVMEGTLAVQAGSQPRQLGERLKAMVPANEMSEAA